MNCRHEIVKMGVPSGNPAVQRETRTRGVLDRTSQCAWPEDAKEEHPYPRLQSRQGVIHEISRPESGPG